MAPATRVLLGHIAGAHGVRGEVLIKPYTADPAAITAYGALTDRDGARIYALVSARVTDKGVIARVAGVSDRTAAEALRGTGLYVARDQLPPPNADEFYHVDLLGMRAVDAALADLGEVTAILNYGAGDILEITPADGGKAALVPFTRDAVPELDFAAGRILVSLPPEILAEPDGSFIDHEANGDG